MTTSRLPYDVKDLHPAIRDAAYELEAMMLAAFVSGETSLHFKPFEGYRTPERQDYLFTVMKTTKAKAWQSAHQYGLAVDFVPVRKAAYDAWTWDAPDKDWRVLHEAGAAVGLAATIKWDKPHLQSPHWEKVRLAIRR